MSAKICPDKAPPERFDLTFPYANELLPGEAIESAVVTVLLKDGVDADPEATRDGSHQIDGTNVLQRVQGGIATCNYGWQCDASTSNGRVLTRALIVPVRSAL